MDRSRAALEEAELVLVVWDASTPVAEEDVALLEQAAARACVILVWNKCDLSAAPATCPPLPRDLPVVEVSAKTGAGLAALEEAVSRCLPAGAGGAAGELLSNARQAEAARQALAGVGRAKLGLAAGITPDAGASGPGGGHGRPGRAHGGLGPGGRHGPDFSAFLRGEIGANRHFAH